MGKNLTGLGKRIGDYKSKAKKMGIDVSFVPRGYSKLSQSEQMKILNKLGKSINGNNYTYQGKYSDKPRSKSGNIRYPKELQQQVAEGQLTPQEAKELGKLLNKELAYNKRLAKRYQGIEMVKGSYGRDSFGFINNMKSIIDKTTREAIYSMPRLVKGAKYTLNDLRKGNHLYNVEKDLDRFDLSRSRFSLLNKGKLKGSGLSRKVNEAFKKLNQQDKLKFLAKFHENFWEEYTDDLKDADMSYQQMYEGLETLINNIINGVI